MNKINKSLKIVKKDIIETNSSSSHSLTLGKNNFIHPGDNEWDIEIKDRILYIPTCEEFGWDFFKFNSLQRKLQYLSGLFFYDGDISVSAQKYMKKLKALLCKVFDIDDVIFEWVETYKNENLLSDLHEDEFDPEYSNFSPVTVDHESRDLKDEIIESEDTLRSYLFSKDSWVFGGSDSSDAPLGFYKEEQRNVFNATASIDFPGLGRLDFRIYYPGNIKKYILNDIKCYVDFLKYESHNFLEFIIYNKEKKIASLVNEEIKYDNFSKVDLTNYMEFTSIISYKGDYYCLYTQTQNGDLLYNIKSTTNWSKVFKEIVSDNSKSNTLFEIFRDNSNEYGMVLDSGLVKEEEDFKLFKIEIKHDDFIYITKE
jgi:hypothetical protein